MKSEQNKKPLFKKTFSSKYKDDDVKYKQQYSNPEFENNSVSDLSPINELDSTDPLDKPFNIEEERNKMVDGVKKWRFLKKPVEKNIYNALVIKTNLTSLIYIPFLTLFVLIFSNIFHLSISMFIICALSGLIGYYSNIIYSYYTSTKSIKAHITLFDEEFIKEIHLKILGDSIIITQSFLLYHTRSVSNLIPKEDIYGLRNSYKNFNMTIVLKSNKKIKIKCTDESQRTSIENWFNTNIF